MGSRGGPGDPPRPASALRTSQPATLRCGTWSGCSCGTGGRWAQCSPRWSQPAAGSQGIGLGGPKPGMATSWPVASAAPVAPSSVPPLAGAWICRQQLTRLKAALQHKEASQGIVGDRVLPVRSPKPGLWAPGGPRCGSSPPDSTSTPRRSRRRTSATSPILMRWTQPWRAPTTPMAAGRTARRQDPATPTHGGTRTPGLADTESPVSPHSWRQGLGRRRVGLAVAPTQGTGTRVAPQAGWGLFAPCCQGELVAGRRTIPASIQGAARGWEMPLVPRSSPVSPWTPPHSRGLEPQCQASTSLLPPPPKRPAPRCLAGKPSSPVATAGHRAKEPEAQSLMVRALCPSSLGARWGWGSSGVPAAPGGSRGAPSVPCSPTTATTPAGRMGRTTWRQAEVRDPCTGVLGGSPMRQGRDCLTMVTGAPSQPAASPVTPVPQEAAYPPGEAARMSAAQQQQQHPAGSVAHR